MFFNNAEITNKEINKNSSGVILSPLNDVLNVERTTGAFIPVQTVTPALKESTKTRGKLGSGLGNPLIPATTAPFLFEDTGRGYDFIPPFTFGSFDFLELGVNNIKGGKRVTAYTPSFSALLFNIQGKAPKGIETGINFRPITKGFKFFRRIKI